MNKKLISASVVAALTAPSLILAFNAGPLPNAVPGIDINPLIDTLFGILWPVTVAFFIFMFVMSSFQFFLARGDAEAIKGARNSVLWGIVGMVVALVAWSIPFIVRNTLGNGI